jgi:hypothetical protein
MSECDREASITRRPWPTRGCCDMEKMMRIPAHLQNTCQRTEIVCQLKKPACRKIIVHECFRRGVIF